MIIIRFLIFLIGCSFMMKMVQADDTYAPYVPVDSRSACVQAEDVRSRTVIVEKYGRGAGSGVILNAHYILTAAHVVKDLAQNMEAVWVKLPYQAAALTGDLPVSAHVVTFDEQDDLALLKLDEPMDFYGDVPILHEKDMRAKSRVFLAGYAHGDASRFAFVDGVYQAPARRKPDGPINSLYVILNQRAYGGDSGAPLFTCHGELMGIHIGNMAHQGKPNHIAVVAPGNIRLFLAQAM